MASGVSPDLSRASRDSPVISPALAPASGSTLLRAFPSSSRGSGDPRHCPASTRARPGGSAVGLALMAGRSGGLYRFDPKTDTDAPSCHPTGQSGPFRKLLAHPLHRHFRLGPRSAGRVPPRLRGQVFSTSFRFEIYRNIRLLRRQSETISSRSDGLEAAPSGANWQAMQARAYPLVPPFSLWRRGG